MVWNKKNIGFFVSVFLCFSVSGLFTACPHKTPHTPQTPQKPPEVVDMAAIQESYNQGLQFYADEQYAEAKKAWQRVIQMGPKTSQAAKARAYLKKVNRMLKTLKEIEKKQ
jgi:TolA-binding protein